MRFILGAAAFGLVAALWMGFVMLWTMRRSARDRSVQERLGLLEATRGPDRVLRLWREGGLASTTVPGSVQAMSWLKKLRRAHYQAGLNPEIGPTVAGLVGVSLILSIGAYFLSHNVIAAIAVPFFTVTAYSAWLARRVFKRANRFERQFVHALELASRSLRAGHPLLGAFQLIADELEDPVSSAFSEICQQHSMGVSLEAALERVAAASMSADLRLFATSVAIQLRSGGNLADMMDRLAYVIRDRMRLGRRIRVLTSQTQFSKRILIAMPFVLFAVLNALNAEYLLPLYQTHQGQVLLAIGTGMMVLGIVVMNRLAVLRY